MGDVPSYVHAATMEHLLHWKRMPIHVFFVLTGAATPERRRQALAGFDEWVLATDSVVSYRVVRAPSLADLTVTISPETTVPGVPGAVGNTLVVYAHTELKSASMELATGGTTPNQLQEVAAHEFGHALGIDGHSDDADDLMAPTEIRVYDPYGSPIEAPAHAITVRDLNTLKACYGSLYVAPAQPRAVFKERDQDFETIEPATGTR